MQIKFSKHAVVLVVACAGMVTGHLIGRQLGNLLPFAQAQDEDEISVQRLTVKAGNGQSKIQLGTTSGGAPAMWFIDQNGKSRINLGLYEDGNAFIVLNDDQEQAVQIFRTVGGNRAPVAVFKSKGQDRMVMGLDFNNGEPFLTYYDNSGSKTKVFGNY